MLDAMRQLALDALWVELDQARSPDPERWYEQLRATSPGMFFPWLVEDPEPGGSSARDKQRFYTLRPDPSDKEVAILEVHEWKPQDRTRLPFNQPTGSQSAALGPLIKRTPPGKGKPAGPSVKIQQTSLKAFEEIGKAGMPWSPYFSGATECFLRPKLRYGGRVVAVPGGAFQRAVEAVDEKRTVFLAYAQPDGKLPGAVPEYVEYLQGVLAETKYATAQAPAQRDQTCALCGLGSPIVYPNGLRGAGINLANLDRDGAFPGLDPAAAWKGYALCVPCADLLYVYWNHVAADYLVTVAGYPALVIPATQLDPGERKRFGQRLRELAAGISKDEVPAREKALLRLLGEDRAVTTLTFLWAEFGQRIDDIRGVVTDVLPSRLRALTDHNRGLEQTKATLFPEWPLEEFEYGLALGMLRPLFRRPGGKKAQGSNDSRRLFDLRRDLAEAIYHAGALPNRFWEELHETARWHWAKACDAERGWWGLLHEGRSEKSDKTFLTAAGWVRQVARFLHYLRLTGVMPMPESATLYQPKCAALKPYFTPESAVDSEAKAFAFILGMLYGKVMQVQAARGVNVGANALTWLKRLTLTGRDLPELYVKVREKLLAYETEGSETVRQLVTELGELGTRLGTDLALNDTETCYFLLLGQSLATKVMPSKNPTEQGAPA